MYEVIYERDVAGFRLLWTALTRAISTSGAAEVLAP
jgi:hypothetical protein